MEGLRERIRRSRKLLNPILNKLSHLRNRISEEKELLSKYAKDKKDILSAQKLIQEVSEVVQQKAHAQIAGVVTKCLRTVFGDDSYEFKIVFEQKRGRTEARSVLTRKDKNEVIELDGIMDSSGGGIVDLISFALRLACLVLSIPKNRRLLILDEPFKHLSIEYRKNVRMLLETLAREMKIQIVMVTHSKRLACGKVIELNGYTLESRQDSNG